MAIDAFLVAARGWSPSFLIEAEELKIVPILEPQNVGEKLTNLQSLSYAFWLEIYTLSGKINPYEVIRKMNDEESPLSTSDAKRVEIYWNVYLAIPRYVSLGFLYNRARLEEVQAVVYKIRDYRLFNKNLIPPLEGISFNGCKFITTDLSDLSILNSTFRGANCFEANFSRVIASKCNFVGANLCRVNFSDATLQYCDFSEANLEDAVFTGAKIAGSIFTGDKELLAAQLPDALELEKAIIDTTKPDNEVQF